MPFSRSSHSDDPFDGRMARVAWAKAFSGALLLMAGVTSAGCSKPEPLEGTYTATCTFKGAYRGGGRADSAWTRQCTITLEKRSETEVAMRFDSGDAVECYGHGPQLGSAGERKVTFPKNDLTCRAKTLPAPSNIRVEQCTMPATFEIAEAVEKDKKTKIVVKTTLEVADKRACVFSYLDKVTIDGKLAKGGNAVTIEAFQDAGLPPAAVPSHDLPPAFPPPRASASTNAGDARPTDAGAPRDASTK